MITIHHPWVFAFGLLGNVISFMVFLAPVPTFIRVYKKKSTEGFQSIPYVVAIFSSMLWIYYALLKGNAVLLITINSAGVVIETIYIAIYITYAPKQAKMLTLKLMLLLNFAGFSAIILFCHYLLKGETRIQVYGWICVAVSISVFIAPLSVIRLVIRTKSVEFMPFNLSVCLTLTAVIWFMYGMLQKDLYITLPNVLGFIFGVAQMGIYGMYRKYDKAAEKQKLPEQIPAVVKQEAAAAPPEILPQDQPPVCSFPPKTEDIIIVPQEIEIEGVFGKRDIEEGKIDHPEEENNLHGPSSCNVDAGKIVGGPAALQLVQCAV